MEYIHLKKISWDVPVTIMICMAILIAVKAVAVIQTDPLLLLKKMMMISVVMTVPYSNLLSLEKSIGIFVHHSNALM